MICVKQSYPDVLRRSAPSRTHSFTSMNLRKRHLTPTISPQYEGAFVVGEEMYVIRSVDSYQHAKKHEDVDVPDSDFRDSDHRHARMIVYRNHDVRLDSVTSRAHQNEGVTFCGADDLHWNQEGDHGAHGYFSRQKQAFSRGNKSSIEHQHNLNANQVYLSKRVYTGCPLSKKILYMGVAADCAYIKYYGSENAARTQILSNWNIVSAIYEDSFNVYLGLIEIVMFPDCGTPTFNQQCSGSYTISNRLSDFSQWRGTKDKSAGLWHLVGGIRGTEAATGSHPLVDVKLQVWLAFVKGVGDVQWINGYD